MRWLSTSALALGTLLVAAQAVRFDRTAPPGRSDLPAPPEIKRILRGACYDCHSNETTWPWYSEIAPFSWLIGRDVHEGRRRLNFSEWDDYASDPETAARKLEQISTIMAEGEMAPWYYRLLHPEARLTAAQRELVANWAKAERVAARAASKDETDSPQRTQRVAEALTSPRRSSPQS